MNHRDYIFLKKIKLEISVGISFIEGISQEAFLKDEKLKRAVSMTAINVGQLVKGLTDITTKAYPNIPWKKIAGFRDIAAHKYETLNMADVYDVVKIDYPTLLNDINDILDKNVDEKK